MDLPKIKRLSLLLFFLLSSFELFAADEPKVVDHKVEDPFWESNKFEFGPFKGKPMDVEFFRAARIVPPAKLKELYGITLPDGYIAIANVRGKHVAADTLLGSASHYIVLLPMDYVNKVDFVSTSIVPGVPIRHSAFRFHFEREALAFPQVRPKGSKKYKVAKARKMKELFFDTAPVDPKPDWTLTPEQQEINRQIYQQGSLTPNAVEGFSANWRDMKAISRLAYLPEEYRPPEARFVELELEPREPVRLLTEWVRLANKTDYKEPYKLMTANCYTDACGMLKNIFEGRVKTDLTNSCRRMLSSLPLGVQNELVHLQTLGMIKASAKWIPLPVPKSP